MRLAIGFAVILAAFPASAEVVSSSANGFHVRHSVALNVPAKDAFAAFIKAERWWDPAHSYSGKAEALSRGADKLAPAVDEVLGGQWQRFAASAAAK